MLRATVHPLTLLWQYHISALLSRIPKDSAIMVMLINVLQRSSIAVLVSRDMTNVVPLQNLAFLQCSALDWNALLQE